VSLSLQSRRVGDVTVVTCAGQLVAGDESEYFVEQLDLLLRVNPVLLLHFDAVDFVDSAGLGLLVRYSTRPRNAPGELRLCAVSPPVDRVLQVTRLKPILQLYDSEAEAIVAGHSRSPSDALVDADLLCVDASEDVLAYLRELLRGAGYRVMTASNVADAAILLRVTRPRAVIVGGGIRAITGTSSAEEFHRRAAERPVIDLPAGFARQDAGVAAQHILETLGGMLPAENG
jgi:anti-sigma B factor antagonist